MSHTCKSVLKLQDTLLFFFLKLFMLICSFQTVSQHETKIYSSFTKQNWRKCLLPVFTWYPVTFRNKWKAKMFDVRSDFVLILGSETKKNV